MNNNINEYYINLDKVYKNAHLVKDPFNTAVECLAILLGDYSIERKYASLLLLKIIFIDDFLNFLLEDEKIYPIERTDKRVKKWTKQVISRGKCEKCGSVENLEAHHIISWSEYPQGRIDIKNGQCLCLKCHTEVHRHDVSYHLMKGKLIKKGGGLYGTQWNKELKAY